MKGINLSRFPGQYYDQETGLHYNYFRYYNPQTGRYITPDPIGLWGGINLFSYTANNPVSFIDPRGLYGRDVHYDLTIRIATEVGFPSSSAREIARANQDVDDNLQTSPWRSRRNRELWHFASQGRIHLLLNRALGSCDLTDLGEALHVLQDSFSHAGYGPEWGHVANPGADSPTSNWGKYFDMSIATRNLLKDFSKKCGFGCNK